MLLELILLWFNWSNWWTHFTCRSRVWLHVYDVYKVFTSSISLNFVQTGFLFSILIVYFLNKKIFCFLRIVLDKKQTAAKIWMTKRIVLQFRAFDIEKTAPLKMSLCNTNTLLPFRRLLKKCLYCNSMQNIVWDTFTWLKHLDLILESDRVCRSFLNPMRFYRHWHHIRNLI